MAKLRQTNNDWMLMIRRRSSRHYFGFVWNLVWAVKVSANHNNGTLNIRLHWSYAKLCWKQSNLFDFHIFTSLISFCRNSPKKPRDTYSGIESCNSCSLSKDRFTWHYNQWTIYEMNKIKEEKKPHKWRRRGIKILALKAETHFNGGFICVRL